MIRRFLPSLRDQIVLALFWWESPREYLPRLCRTHSPQSQLQVELLEDRCTPAGMWEPIGPAPQHTPNGQDISGRIRALAWAQEFDGAKYTGKTVLFLGTASGGVWRG